MSCGGDLLYEVLYILCTAMSDISTLVLLTLYIQHCMSVHIRLAVLMYNIYNILHGHAQCSTSRY